VILPSKSIPGEKSLIALGGRVLDLLQQSPLTVTSVWTELHASESAAQTAPTSFEWFVLSLDMLYALGAIELEPTGVLRTVES